MVVVGVIPTKKKSDARGNASEQGQKIYAVEVSPLLAFTSTEKKGTMVKKTYPGSHAATKPKYVRPPARHHEDDGEDDDDDAASSLAASDMDEDVDEDGLAVVVAGGGAKKRRRPRSREAVQGADGRDMADGSDSENGDDDASSSSSSDDDDDSSSVGSDFDVVQDDDEEEEAAVLDDSDDDEDGGDDSDGSDDDDEDEEDEDGGTKKKRKRKNASGGRKKKKSSRGGAAGNNNDNDDASVASYDSRIDMYRGGASGEGGYWWESKNLAEETLYDPEENELRLQEKLRYIREQRASLVENLHQETRFLESNAELQALSRVVRNERGEIVDPLHCRSPALLTKYEFTAITSRRAEQLERNDAPLIELPADMNDSLVIAHYEFTNHALDDIFIVQRPFPDGTSEYWRLGDLEFV